MVIMRNISKTTTLESRFPLLAIENDCIISKEETLRCVSV